MKKSVAVLGLGKYGRSVAKSLYAIGEDVLVADKDERRIRDISSKVTSAVCANLENEDEVNLHIIKNMLFQVYCLVFIYLSSSDDGKHV